MNFYRGQQVHYFRAKTGFPSSAKKFVATIVAPLGKKSLIKFCDEDGQQKEKRVFNTSLQVIKERSQAGVFK